MTEKILANEMMSDAELYEVAVDGLFDFVEEIVIELVVNKVVDVVETVAEKVVEVVQANETHTADYIL